VVECIILTHKEWHHLTEEEDNMAEIVTQEDIRKKVLTPEDIATENLYITNRPELQGKAGVRYINPAEMTNAANYGKMINPETKETYTGLPAISSMPDNSGYGMGKVGLQIYNKAEGYTPPEGTTREGGYDTINQTPIPTAQPQQEQKMATFQDAIGLAEKKFGIPLGSDPYELARKETDAEASMALKQFFPGKTLATLTPQELKQYQTNYAQVYNQKSAQNVAKIKDMTAFVKEGLNYINEDHKRTNEELRAENARLKEIRKENKPSYTSTNVTFKDGTEGIANYSKSGKYYDPVTGNDISSEIQLKSIKKPSTSIPALKKLVSEAGEEPDSTNIDLINKAAEEHGLEYREITPVVENPWYKPNEKAKWGLVKKVSVAEKETPKLKKITPEVIKQIKSKAKTREEAEKMATDMGYDIGG
jgi:hypothetical protein